jgi:hypothetical protein
VREKLSSNDETNQIKIFSIMRPPKTENCPRISQVKYEKNLGKDLCGTY